jgi:hypothetical protein
MFQVDDTPAIFTPVTALAFAAQHEVQCRELLVQRAANTEMVPLADESQLIMAADGRLAETQYRFNVIGFSAVAAALAPGLSNLFQDLSGALRRKAGDSVLYNLPAAVSIYNTTLRLRFDLLRERSLLIDHGERTVCGFLGLDHKMLPNEVFFSVIQEELTARQPSAMFYRAEISGREARIYYVDSDSKSTTIHPNPAYMFARGWYFVNREDAGHAIRAVPCLFTKFGAALLSSGRKNRLSHIGADLVGRTTALVAQAGAQAPDMDQLRHNVRAMTMKSLGFSERKEDMVTATTRLINVLQARGVARQDAKSIVHSAATVGADLEPGDPLDVYTNKILRRRNMYDLVCAALRFARMQPTATCERVQFAAMQLLFPKIKSSPGTTPGSGS